MGVAMHTLIRSSFQLVYDCAKEYCNGPEAANEHFFEWSKTFSYRRAKLWNALANEVKQAASLSVFKQSFFVIKI